MALNRIENPLPLREIEYWINWLSSGFASGKWDSIYRGRGFDLRGTAPFNDDPDPVRINWRASAIYDELLVNQFAEERDVHLNLLTNLGPSMAFGSQERKLDRLAVLTAILSFSAFRLKDRFRFVGYTDELEYGFPQPREKGYPYQIAQAIMDFDWQGKKRGGLIKAAASLPSRRSLIILISDFLGNPEGLSRALGILAPRHEILPLVLWDEREVTLPGQGFGLYPFYDLETGEPSFVFLTPASRRRFAEESTFRREKLEELFGRYGLQPHFLIGGQTDDDIEELMKIFLHMRSRI